MITEDHKDKRFLKLYFYTYGIYCHRVVWKLIFHEWLDENEKLDLFLEKTILIHIEVTLNALELGNQRVWVVFLAILFSSTIPGLGIKTSSYPTKCKQTPPSWNEQGMFLFITLFVGKGWKPDICINTLHYVSLRSVYVVRTTIL
jgi:hypothetical protein